MSRYNLEEEKLINLIVSTKSSSKNPEKLSINLQPVLLDVSLHFNKFKDFRSLDKNILGPILRTNKPIHIKALGILIDNMFSRYLSLIVKKHKPSETSFIEYKHPNFSYWNILLHANNDARCRFQNAKLSRENRCWNDIIETHMRMYMYMDEILLTIDGNSHFWPDITDTGFVYLDFLPDTLSSDNRTRIIQCARAIRSDLTRVIKRYEIIQNTNQFE